MKRFTAIFLTLPLSPLWAADLPAPGLYEVSAEMMSSELQVESTTYTTTTCLTSENLEADLSRNLSALPSGQDCEILSFEMANGNARITVSCSTPVGDMQVESRGSYSADSYSMVSTVTTVLIGRELKIDSKVEGKRIGEC